MKSKPNFWRASLETKICSTFFFHKQNLTLSHSENFGCSKFRAIRHASSDNEHAMSKEN